MGLLDKLTGNRNDGGFTPQESYMGIMLCVAAGDGHISDEESDAISTEVNRMQLFVSQTRDEFSRMMDKLLGLLQKQNVGYVLDRAVSAIPDELKETAFATAVDLVFSDGEVEDDERDIIQHLLGVLEIPESTAEKIIEVMEIRNRG